jgi:hypothetical protein
MSGTSFQQGSDSLHNLGDLPVSAKQVERVVRRIGQERCDQRDAEVEAFLRLPLVEKSQAPPGVTPPNLAVVMADGGRIQILDRSQPADDQARPGQKQPEQPGQDGTRPDPTSPPDSSPATSQDSPTPLAGAESLSPLPTGEEEDDPEVSEPGSRSQHWREDKIGLLLEMSSPAGQQDPCPDIPRHFLNQQRIEKLTRELKAKARAQPTPTDDPGSGGVPTPAASGPEQEEAAKDEEPTWDPPVVQARKVVATRQPWKRLGQMLAAAAWSLGFFAAARQAFLGDGSAHVWGVWRRHFSKFVPILDFIHALSYVYAAALAGRSRAEGWAVYLRWIGWVWQGKVEKVIEELRQRQQEVGQPGPEEKETSPAVVIKEALTFLENHKGQMKYNEYRQQGLPITTSHVESEIKRINHRVKGTEKFWSEAGAEYILQLRADYLSDDKPMDSFWQNRQAQETGQNRYRRRQ